MMNKKQKEQVKKLLPVVGIAGVAGVAYYVMRSRKAAQGNFQPAGNSGRNRRNRTQNDTAVFNPTSDWGFRPSSGGTGSSSGGGGTSSGMRRLTFRLSADQIRAVQRRVGVTDDGKWGPRTDAAFQQAASAANLPLQIDEPTLTAWLQGRANIGAGTAAATRPTVTVTNDNAMIDARRMHDRIFTNRNLTDAQKLQQAFLYLRNKNVTYRRMIQSAYDRSFGQGINPSFRRRMQNILNVTPAATPNRVEFSVIINSLT